MRSYPAHILKVVTISTCIIFLLVAACMKSRSFVIGYVVAALFIWLAAANFRVKKSVVLISSAIFTIFLSALIMFIKHDSSLGRLFIYKISFSIWKDNYLWGIGNNNFEKVYNLYQETYFSQGHYSLKELLLADNTYYAFNDYYQLVIEWGVPGLILLIVACMTFVQSAVNAYKSGRRDRWELTLIISNLLAVCAAAFFTHVFEKLVFFIFLLCSTFYLVIVGELKNRITKYSMLIGISALALLTITREANKLSIRSAENNWKYAEQLINAGEVTAGVKILGECNQYLAGNPSYLHSYGRVLMGIRQEKLAIGQFQRALVLAPSSKILVSIAEYYTQMGEMGDAEIYYKRAINMTPNRFKARFQLYSLYVSTGELKKADLVGNEILNLPAKVPSEIIVNMKNSVLLTSRKF